MDARMAHDSAQWPDPIEVLNEGGPSPIVLVCEHASNHVPDQYDGLGLRPADLVDHIAWDPGAAALTRALSDRLSAPAFLGTYSRLLIDLNRPIHVPSAMPKQSEATDIPGNQTIALDEALHRVRRIFTPFHARIQAHLDERQLAGRPTTVISIHSFSPSYLGATRPWHAGVLYNRCTGLGEGIADALAADAALHIGRNAPYRIEAESDYCVLVHGEARALPAVLIEVRNDQLATPEGVDAWTARLADAFVSVAV